MPHCLPCYKDYISCGNETLYVIGKLTANADYEWILTAPNGAKYSGDATTDDAGHFEIDVSELPEALLNPYAGEFTLQVQPADAYRCNDATWNNSAYCSPYDCISFNVVNGDSVKNTLGCDCELI